VPVGVDRSRETPAISYLLYAVAVDAAAAYYSNTVVFVIMYNGMCDKGLAKGVMPTGFASWHVQRWKRPTRDG